MAKITSAAVLHAGVVATGRNHGECLAKLPRDRRKWLDVQGFVTDRGDFVDRVEAFGIALAAGQLKPGYREFGKLYSEDLKG